MLRYRTKLNLV